jgi:2'-5' RNA ligase
VRPRHPLTHRLFIAFRLPPFVVEALSAWQKQTVAHVPAVRPMPAAQFHVTAVFLGSTPAADVPQVIDLTRHAVHNARRPAFRIDRYHETSRVGMVTLREERVGHDPYAGRAAELTGHLMIALEAAGRYVREHRAWRPHVTVARFRTAPRLQPEAPVIPPFAAVDVALYESALSPAGSTYTALELFPFRDEAATLPRA